MSKDHVTQPMAARLQAAGWEYPVAEYIGYDPLPLASIGELRERLTLDDFHIYWKENIIDRGFASWLYDVTADADALAEVWLETHGKEAKP